MTIASFTFLGFALAVVLIYNCFSSVTWRMWVLLVADLAFLSTFSQIGRASCRERVFNWV